MNQCPTCRGEKVLHGYGCPGFRPITLKCWDCGGTGEVSDEKLVWKRDGEVLKTWRMGRDMSLREAARWAAVEPREWSDAEHGKVDPHPLRAKVQALAIAAVRGGYER